MVAAEPNRVGNPRWYEHAWRRAVIDRSKFDMKQNGKPVLQADGAADTHQGIQGKRALFLDKSATQGLQVEITGA